ncbi:hypothetical protein J7F03_14215 [Streptomyces sp. ISL-43]|uniref:hypothetical protein n=1 Tax=Streptomyces sp. ISL-43 TaxID=2819183 RepID=UPI001BEA81F5|nr:hypothetical protein [Streptomyces sp. ISL-43]MBT2448215.1 hypothetical protein [Streptomyces sp. ISL-43]
MSSRPSAFEERLKAELVAIAAEGAQAQAETKAGFAVRSPARRLRMPLAVGLAASAAAALIALPVMGDEGGTSAAYALTKGEDGTITVKLFNPEGLPGLERELRGLGVPVVVVDQKPVAECDATGGGFDGPVMTPDGKSWEPYEDVLASNGDEPVLKINSKTVKPGHTLVLVRPMTPSRKGSGAGFGTMETSRVPSCIPAFWYGLDASPEGPMEPPGGPASK